MTASLLAHGNVEWICIKSRSNLQKNKPKEVIKKLDFKHKCSLLYDYI